MKKVESIWAELSAKQVENTQEVELSEEKVELGIGEELDAIKKILDSVDIEIGAAESQSFVKRAYDAIIVPSKAKMTAIKLKKALKELQSAGMGGSRIANAIEQKLEAIDLMSDQAKRLRSLLADMVSQYSKYK